MHASWMPARTVGAMAIGLAWVLGAQAAVVFVDDNAPPGGNGQTWATAYTYLQDALTAALNSGGTITEVWVAAGTYRPNRDNAHPNGTGSRTATFQLINGVAIYGGLAGTEDPVTFNLADRDFQANQTILSGDLAGNDGPDFANNDENSYHVVTGSGTGATAVLDGVTVTGGNANGSTDADKRGGGIVNTGGSPTLSNCTLVGNSATGYSSGLGGGMYNATSNPTLTNCVFSGNWAGSEGGGMYNSSSNPALTGCTFNGNWAGGGGGGMCNESSGGLSLNNCTFSRNGAWDGSGGAILNGSSSSPW